MMNKIVHEGSAIENVLGDDETCQFKDAKDANGAKGVKGVKGEPEKRR